MDIKKDGQTDGRTNGRMDGRADRQTNGQTERQIDRRTDELTFRSQQEYIILKWSATPSSPCCIQFHKATETVHGIKSRVNSTVCI